MKSARAFARVRPWHGFFAHDGVTVCPCWGICPVCLVCPVCPVYPVYPVCSVCPRQLTGNVNFLLSTIREQSSCCRPTYCSSPAFRCSRTKCIVLRADAQSECATQCTDKQKKEVSGRHAAESTESKARGKNKEKKT